MSLPTLYHSSFDFPKKSKQRLIGNKKKIGSEDRENATMNTAQLYLRAFSLCKQANCP
jgi:hypothetical protein